MLYKKHRFWCFSFVTLFNLQGTRPPASAAELTLSYHVGHLLSSTFFNFFEVFSALASAFRRSLRQLIYCIKASRVCQVLFLLRFEVLRRFPFGLPPFSDSLSSISELSEFVKHFFHFVEIFSLSRWHDRRVSDSLLTIPDTSSFVNTFFPLFLFFYFPALPHLLTFLAEKTWIPMIADQDSSSQVFHNRCIKRGPTKILHRALCRAFVLMIG